MSRNSWADRVKIRDGTIQFDERKRIPKAVIEKRVAMMRNRKKANLKSAELIAPDVLELVGEVFEKVTGETGANKRPELVYDWSQGNKDGFKKLYQELLDAENNIRQTKLVLEKNKFDFKNRREKAIRDLQDDRVNLEKQRDRVGDKQTLAENLEKQVMAEQLAAQEAQDEVHSLPPTQSRSAPPAAPTRYSESTSGRSSASRRSQAHSQRSQRSSRRSARSSQLSKQSSRRSSKASSSRLKSRRSSKVKSQDLVPKVSDPDASSEQLQGTGPKSKSQSQAKSRKSGRLSARSGSRRSSRTGKPQTSLVTGQKAIMKRLGTLGSDEIGAFDRQGDGTLGYPDFKDMFNQEDVSESAIRNFFLDHDNNKDGTLDVKYLSQLSKPQKETRQPVVASGRLSRTATQSLSLTPPVPKVTKSKGGSQNIIVSKASLTRPLSSAKLVSTRSRRSSTKGSRPRSKVVTRSRRSSMPAMPEEPATAPPPAAPTRKTRPRSMSSNGSVQVSNTIKIKSGSKATTRLSKSAKRSGQKKRPPSKSSSRRG